jgi:putative hemolysin
MSREDLRELVFEAAKSGSLDSSSSEIAARAIELGEVLVDEVMARRERIVAIRRDASPDEIQQLLLEEGHSRMPVYEGSLDHVVGYIVARDVLALAWEGDLIAVPDIIRPIVSVALGTRANRLLRELQSKRAQMAIVIDEHGDTTGLVTIEDLLEELVGDIFGEHDTTEELVHYGDDGWAVVPAWLPTRRVNRQLNTALPISRESTTIAGLCMVLALGVPSAGSTLVSPDGTRLEVLESSPRRVRMVRIRPRDPSSADPAVHS